MPEPLTVPEPNPAPARSGRHPRWSWPGLCAVCRGWGRGRLCDDCTRRFAGARERCHRCALPVPTPTHACGACMTTPPPYDAAIAAVDYAAPWDRLVAGFKFHGALELAPVFARALVTAVRERGADLPDLLLPVPLAAERLRERGYNQAWEIARRAARSLGVAGDPRLLLRVRDTAHQLALPPGERGGNVRNAFAVEPSRRQALAGRHVALIDDVMTTGHTVAELARVLKQSGAGRVSVWVLARTQRDDDGLAAA